MTNPIRVKTTVPLIEGVDTVEYDPALYDVVDAAIRRANWHPNDQDWVDGYACSFTVNVLHALDQRYELRLKATDDDHS
jgi:hypothetical protein